jgi:hypothetical protein
VQRLKAVAGVENEIRSASGASLLRRNCGATGEVIPHQRFTESHTSVCNPNGDRGISPFFSEFRRHFDRVFRRCFGNLSAGAETLANSHFGKMRAGS